MPRRATKPASPTATGVPSCTGIPLGRLLVRQRRNSAHKRFAKSSAGFAPPRSWLATKAVAPRRHGQQEADLAAGEVCVNALAARCPHHGACPSASVSHSPLSLSHSPLQRVRDTRQIRSSGRAPHWQLSRSPLSLSCARHASLLTPLTRTAPLAPVIYTRARRLGDVRAASPPTPLTLRRSHGRAGEPSSDEAAQGCALRAARCTDRRVQPNPPARVLADLNKYPVEGFSAGLVDETNVFEWEIMIMGPPDTH